MSTDRQDRRETIVLVQDNLNTHAAGSLYEAFPAAEARRLVERFEWRYTPKPALKLAQDSGSIDAELGVSELDLLGCDRPRSTHPRQTEAATSLTRPRRLGRFCESRRKRAITRTADWRCHNRRRSRVVETATSRLIPVRFRNGTCEPYASTSPRSRRIR